MGGKKKGGGGGSKKAKRGNKQTPPKNKAHKGGREEASAMSCSRNLAIPSSVPVSFIADRHYQSSVQDYYQPILSGFFK